MTLFSEDLFMCACILLADVASTEQQQQSAKDSSKAQEEEALEDTSMDTEEQEELKAVDTEQLKPEEVKAGTMAPPGEACGEHIPPSFALWLREATSLILWFVFSTS